MAPGGADRGSFVSRLSAAQPAGAGARDGGALRSGRGRALGRLRQARRCPCGRSPRAGSIARPAIAGRRCRRQRLPEGSRVGPGPSRHRHRGRRRAAAADEPSGADGSAPGAARIPHSAAPRPSARCARSSASRASGRDGSVLRETLSLGHQARAGGPDVPLLRQDVDGRPRWRSAFLLPTTTSSRSAWGSPTTGGSCAGGARRSCVASAVGCSTTRRSTRRSAASSARPPRPG